MPDASEILSRVVTLKCKFLTVNDFIFRQKERERLREQDQPKEHGGERQRVLRSDQESADKNENRSTRELRSSDEKHVEVSEVHPSNEITGNKLLTQTMETQCKQTVDDLIARYLARKPLPGIAAT